MNKWLVEQPSSAVSSGCTRACVVRVAAFFAIVKFGASMLVAVFEEPVTAGTSGRFRQQDSAEI